MYQRLGRFYRKIIVPQILTKCKRIITVSHFECNRISHFLHIDKQLLVAVYNGYSQHFIPIRNAQAITARYIKNHPYLFLFRKYRSQEEYGKGIAGIRHLFKKIQSAPSLAYRRPERRDHRRISEPGRITRNKKNACHPDTFQTQNYPLFIVEHPSLYTRLYAKVSASPFLEAMACGTPVITSTTSAMPEIAGPEGILVNPFEPEEIASALLHLEENAEFYQSQTAYGLERVRRFSWENTAREILNIYKEILA